MRKSTRKLVTIVSGLILTLSTSFAAFADTATVGNENTTTDKKITENNVYFYVFSPLEKDEETKKIVIENPHLDSAVTVWTERNEKMTGSIAYEESQYREYDIENSFNILQKKAGYIDTDDVNAVLTDLPADEIIEEAIEAMWPSYDYDATKYGIKWIIVKYAHNTWHVDGVIVPLSELEEPTTEEDTTEATTEEQTTEAVTEEETTTETATEKDTTEQQTTEAATEKDTTEQQTTEAVTEEETTTVGGVDIDDEDTPLSDGKDNNTEATKNPTVGGVDIIDEDIPLSDGKDINTEAAKNPTAGGVDIIDENIPLSDGAPQTGDNTVVWVFTLVAVLTAGMIFAVNTKKKDEE
ncbi:MAG: hypothetical protein K2J91_07910 [Lachnospiraceae bacterium]|nr:hypothetical protein [Lachnospiraceae bacterium]